jgi:hypothetical protein
MEAILGGEFLVGTLRVQFIHALEFDFRRIFATCAHNNHRWLCFISESWSKEGLGYTYLTCRTGAIPISRDHEQDPLQIQSTPYEVPWKASSRWNYQDRSLSTQLFRRQRRFPRSG